MPSTRIGERLALARGLSGLSRRDLSLLAGLAQAVVGIIERNRNAKPAPETLDKLSITLGVSLDWLIAGRGRTPTAKTIGAAIKKARESAKNQAA